MTIKLVPISHGEIEWHVQNAFCGDDKLLNKYHIVNGSLSSCVEDTVKNINENRIHFGDKMKFYSVVKDDKVVIGYTIIIKNEEHRELYSFGINIKYRSDKNKKSWLSEIQKTLNKPYYIVLWSKNIRAINFFKQNGFVIDEEMFREQNKTLILTN